MNGYVLANEETSIDRKPIITCAGELEVFASIEDNLTNALPQDASEWKRPMGRPVRMVHIGANFAPFSPAALPKGHQWDLIRQPLFHLYWTECSDIDLYKAAIREDIEIWLKELTSRDITDYLIIVVENYDGKRPNKLLPRTTVLDKIRADFVPKQGDRCISVINPSKVESRFADSWRGLVSRIRHLLLVAYAKAISQLEDYVRQQRERRNDIGWNFMKYFHLQEELAQVLEMLGLYDEALVQYDELDALFSQFVVNGVTGEALCWLNNFQKPLERWYGLKLGPTKLTKDPSILELRAYLFAKQAQMLLLIKKVWEMASRCLPFLHTCSREIAILDITYPPGALACWLFLAALEVLQVCDKFNHAEEVEDYSLHTACLWEYSGQKLRYLGDLCGLMPGGIPTSEQLHMVVGLSAGMGDNPGTVDCPSPTDKLKGALCSQDTFNKTYLELSELAMCTFKHIGRLRSARLVGKEVATFYMLLGETQTAAAFLCDAVRTFELDNWHELAAQTQIQLAECYKKSDDKKKFIKTCASISSTLEMDTLIRWTYFDEMKRYLNNLDNILVVPFKNIIKIISVNVKNDGIIIMQDCLINIELIIESNFPREFLCNNLLISLEYDTKDKMKNDKYCKNRILTHKDLKMKNPLLEKLKFFRHLERKQDKQLASASVVCKHPDLKRKDSSIIPSPSNFEFFVSINTKPLLITPGLNIIKLNQQANRIGKFYLGQIAIYMNKLHLLSDYLNPKLSIEIKEEGPTLKLHKTEAPLLTGIEQIMNLIITIGSYTIDPKSVIKLTASHGLSFQIDVNKPLVNVLELEMGEQLPFTSRKQCLRVLAEMLTEDHQVLISCPWNTKPIIVNLKFSSPLLTTYRLFTTNHRKFLQITITGQCEQDIFIEQPKLSLGIGDIIIDDKNNNNSSQLLSSSLSFLWEILRKNDQITLPSTIKAEFSLFYKLSPIDENKLFKYFFHINDYKTIYIVDADVEPTKGNEFCRVGILCHLHLTIKYCGEDLKLITTNKNNNNNNNNNIKSVMYEVLAVQSVWAIVGRTAGVISFDSDTDPQIVIVDIMPLTSGYLPLPSIQISKYIPAETSANDKSGRIESHPRLESFYSGQVYNNSKGKQVHVIAASSSSSTTTTTTTTNDGHNT